MLSDEQRHIIEHTLGIAQKGREYRNHYAAAENTPRFAELEQMCELGLMERGFHMEHPRGTTFVFHTTEAGRKALEDA